MDGPLLASMLGRWHVAATTLPFWRGKRDVEVSYEDLGAGSWRDTLRYIDGGGRARTLSGRNTLTGAVPGRVGPGALDARFRWRGTGWLAWISSEWRFVRVDPAGAWAVTWFSRATLGVTPAGMDVYVRTRAGSDVDALVEEASRTTEAHGLGAWFRVP